jgi:hypothetical protein
MQQAEYICEAVQKGELHRQVHDIVVCESQQRSGNADETIEKEYPWFLGRYSRLYFTILMNAFQHGYGL